MDNYRRIAEINIANVGAMNHEYHSCSNLAEYAVIEFTDTLISAIELLVSIGPTGNDALLHLQDMKKEIQDNPIYLSVLTEAIKAQRLDLIL